MQAVTCVVVRCDGCDDPEEEDGFTPHWQSEDEARESLTGEGWRFTAHGLQLCGGCAGRVDCARNGHLWSSWQPHYADPTVEERYCAHCARASEERLAAQAYGTTE